MGLLILHTVLPILAEMNQFITTYGACNLTNKIPPVANGYIFSGRRRSNSFPVWLPVPVPVPAQNIPSPSPQILCHVPSLNLTFQNNPQAAEPVDHSLSLSIQNNPPAPPRVNHHPQERFETIQLLPDDLGPFRAPRN